MKAIIRVKGFSTKRCEKFCFPTFKTEFLARFSNVFRSKESLVTLISFTWHPQVRPKNEIDKIQKNFFFLREREHSA